MADGYGEFSLLYAYVVCLDLIQCYLAHRNHRVDLLQMKLMAWIMGTRVGRGMAPRSCVQQAVHGCFISNSCCLQYPLLQVAASCWLSCSLPGGRAGDAAAQHAAATACQQLKPA